MTITTNSASAFRVDGETVAFSALGVGDRFVALFHGSPTDSLSTLVAGPALAVSAHPAEAQHQLYAFTGTVTAVDASADTVTVQVADALPSGLVTAGSAPATFTLSPATMILGGTATNGLFGGSPANVSVGDVVAGGEVGPTGETLSQVGDSPLAVLVDFPATTTASTSSIRRAARSRALTQAEALFGYRGRSHARRSHRHHRTSRSGAHK